MPLELLCSEDPSAPKALYALKEFVNDNVIAIVLITSFTTRIPETNSLRLPCSLGSYDPKAPKRPAPKVLGRLLCS